MNASLPVPRRFFAALATFGAAVFLGHLLTTYPPLSVNNWWLFLLCRVVWTIGSAAWLGWEASQRFKAAPSTLILAVSLAGSVACIDPLMDVLNGGPVHLENAQVTAMDLRRADAAAPGELPTARHGLVFRQANGRLLHVKISGRRGAEWDDTLETCRAEGWSPDDGIDITALEYLGILLQADCTR